MSNPHLKWSNCNENSFNQIRWAWNDGSINNLPRQFKFQNGNRQPVIEEVEDEKLIKQLYAVAWILEKHLTTIESKNENIEMEKISG